MAPKREYPKPVIEKKIMALNDLKGKRLAKGYTEAEMAKYLGITPGTYSRKETGKTIITIGEFLYIREVLESLPVRIKKQSLEKLIQIP